MANIRGLRRARTDLNKQKEHDLKVFEFNRLKQTLPTNVIGATNKTTIGRGQQVNKNLVTPSQLAQQTVRPKAGGLSRIGTAIKEEAKDTLAILTGKGFNRPRNMKEPIKPGEITRKRLDETPIKAGGSTAFASPISGTGPRQIGSSTLTKKGDVDVLRGTRTPGPEIDFTRGKPLKKAKGMKKKDFNIFNFEGLENIVSAAGGIAQELASPEFRKGQRRARGKLASRKARLAETKTIDASIKSISGALQGIAFTGNTELKNSLSGQLDSLLKQRANVGGPVGAGGLNVGTPEDTANSLVKAGFDKEEVASITRRIHGA